MKASKEAGARSPTGLVGSTKASESLMAPAYRSATLGIFGLVSLIAYEAMGGATVMPRAAAELHGISLYGFAFGGPLAASIIGMVASGQRADAHSPLGPTWAGGACFLAGLMIASAAPSMAWLLAGRLVTGFGSGMLAVALYAMVGRIYPTALHAGVFAVFSAAWILPSLIAPGLSGTITQEIGWRWAMVLVAGMTVLALALLRRVELAPLEERGFRAPGRRLRWGILAACAALALHMVGQGNTYGVGAIELATGFGVLIIVAAVMALLISARRLLPPGTLSVTQGFSAAIALNGLSQGAFFAAEAFIPLLLHHLRGVPLGFSGLALAAGALSWTMGAMYRARVHKNVPATRLIRAGMSLLAGGIALTMLTISPSVSVWIAAVGWTFAGAGMGLISPTLSILTLAFVRPGNHGQAGASLRLSAAMATTCALALSGAAFSALIDVSPNIAFAVCLGTPMLLALCGASLAGRADPRCMPSEVRVRGL